jgi:hypothetical protein
VPRVICNYHKAARGWLERRLGWDRYPPKGPSEKSVWQPLAAEPGEKPSLFRVILVAVPIPTCL